MIEAVISSLPQFVDERGSLTALETMKQVPFKISRFFIVASAPGGSVRGGHAHVSCHQFLVRLSGTISVLVEDDHGSREITLSDSETGLYLPPLVWSLQSYADEGSSLLVVASHAYDPSDYIDEREDASFRRSAHIKVHVPQNR